MGFLRVLHGITYGFLVAKSDLFQEWRYFKRAFPELSKCWALQLVTPTMWCLGMLKKKRNEISKPAYRYSCWHGTPVTKPNWNTCSRDGTVTFMTFPSSCSKRDQGYGELHWWSSSQICCLQNTTSELEVQMRFNVTPHHSKGSLPSDLMVFCIAFVVCWPAAAWEELEGNHKHDSLKLQMLIWGVSTEKCHSYTSTTVKPHCAPTFLLLHHFVWLDSKFLKKAFEEKGFSCHTPVW